MSKFTDYIKPFTGEGDFMGWITKVKLVAKLQKIEDVASFIPLHLESDALSIYLEMNEADKSCAIKIEKKLKEAFTCGPFVAYKKMNALKWAGEPVDVFANELRRWGGLAGFKGAELEKVVKLTFINALPEKASLDLQQVENITTLPMGDVLTRARIICANGEGSMSHGGTVAVAANGVNIAAKVRGAPINPIYKQDRPGKKQQEPTEHFTSSAGGFREQPTYGFRGKCYTCGGPHLQRFCSQGRRGVICYRCGGEGHISAQCMENSLNSTRGSAAPTATPSRE